MSRRTEKPYKADGTDKLAQHSHVRCSTPEVNGAVAQGKFTSLLREICASRTAGTSGTTIREDRRGAQKSAEVIVPGGNEPVNTPEGLTTREGLNWADSTTIAERRLAMKPNGGAGSRVRVAEKECCSIRKDCQEPPDADPQVRWCGGWGEQSPQRPD